MVSGSLDKTIKFWNVDTGYAIKTLKEHSEKVFLSRDSKILATGSSDKTIKLWAVETKEKK